MGHERSILLTTLIFPPLGVTLMTGLSSPETILNTLLFIFAVVPSYVHGTFVYWRYRVRQEKLERHQWEELSDRSGRSGRGTRRSRCLGDGGYKDDDDDDYHHYYYDEKPDRYEVEEFSSDNDYKQAARRQRRPSQIGYRPIYLITDVPPPCPDPPVNSRYQRCVQ